MSVSFKRNGSVSASGSGIGANYVMNGYPVNNLQNWTSWGTASDRTVEYKNGLYWLHHKSNDGTGTYTYGGFSQNSYGNNNGADNSQIPIAPNTYYTISALWFASASTGCRYWLHMRSSEGGANLKQMTKDFTIGTEPQWVYYTFNSGTDATYTIDRFGFMLGSIGNSAVNDVYCTYIKFEEGQIPTPYIPCASDTFYMSAASSFIEKPYSNLISAGRDFLVGETIYEY